MTADQQTLLSMIKHQFPHGTLPEASIGTTWCPPGWSAGRCLRALSELLAAGMVERRDTMLGRLIAPAPHLDLLEASA